MVCVLTIVNVDLTYQFMTTLSFASAAHEMNKEGFSLLTISKRRGSAA